MPQTRYAFSDAVSAFFEMPTELARDLLPRHLEPLEIRHGSGVFAVTAFHFTESMVGDDEIVLAVIVPPMLQGGEFPKSAFYPFLLGTSTPESRAHAIERWHLPHHMADVGVNFEAKNGKIDIRVHDDGKPILDYGVAEHQWSRVNHLYQAFMADDSGEYKVDIHMEGRFTEHEEETGWLELHDHPICAKLRAGEIETYPFRELWMQNGVQTFEELEALQRA
jgi:hypothetical protein